MKGLVYKSTGSWYILRDPSGRSWNARTKGVLKLEDITSTNPVAVGDWVDFEIESDAQGTALIDQILPRHNYINRQSPRHKHQHHIVAANLWSPCESRVLHKDSLIVFWWQLKCIM